MPPREPDERFDRLEGRVDDLENERAAIAALPGRVGAVEAIAKSARDNAQATRMELEGMRGDIRAFRQEVRAAHQLGNDLAQRTATAATAPKSWSERLKDSFALMLPVILALISAYAVISAANAGQ